MGILIICLLALTAVVWLMLRRMARAAPPESQAQKWRTLREPAPAYGAAPDLSPQEMNLDRREPSNSRDSGIRRRSEADAGELDEDEERYASFVRAMWERASADLQGILVRRVSRRSETECTLVSLATGSSGRTYVNVVEDGAKRTYAADDRHSWSRDGDLFSSSAFAAVLRGADPQSELTHAAHPDFLAHPLPPIGTLSGLVYGVEYGDSQGEITSRVLRLDDVRPDGSHLFISGHCYLRDGERTFRASRIVGLTDHRTGNVIERPPDHFQQFVSGESLTHPDHRRAFKRAKPGLTALLWAARADIVAGEASIAILLAFAEERLQLDPRTQLPPEALDPDLLRYWCGRMRPTGAEAGHAIAVMWAGGKEIRLVCAHLGRLAALGSEPIRKRAHKLLGEARR
ncbi:MAG: hypothetical protein JWM36_3230 [Hyphomicrobiales bacterium]|nr:hypothetical protein [Hyphomicrobiales bacterium]